MTDQPIDELLATAAPVGDAEIAAFPMDGLDRRLREVIMSTPAADAIVHTPSRVSSNEGRRWWRGIGAAAAAAAVLVAGFVMAPLGGDDDSAWAAEILAVAQASPRLLVDLPGWEVIRADQFTVEQGEMTFSDGQVELDLFWRAATSHDEYVADRAASSSPPRTVTVSGFPATEFRYLDSTDFTTLWLDGEHSFEVRGVFPDRASYARVVSALTPTEVDAWLNAMPETVVRPESREAVVASMLADIPQPEGFDVGRLVSEATVRDRYQLGAKVSGAVACAWIGQWFDARSTGDATAEAEALDAMRTSRQWAILGEMANSGAYPQVLWLHVDGMEAAGGTAPSPILLDNYREALGCPE